MRAKKKYAAKRQEVFTKFRMRLQKNLAEKRR